MALKGSCWDEDLDNISSVRSGLSCMCKTQSANHSDVQFSQKNAPFIFFFSSPREKQQMLQLLMIKIPDDPKGYGTIYMRGSELGFLSIA